MPKKFVRPADAAAVTFIYTAGEFQWNDSLIIKPVTMNLTWEKPDGSVIPLGQKDLIQTEAVPPEDHRFQKECFNYH